VLTELDQPRPDAGGPARNSEGAIHHDIRHGDDVVPETRLGAFGRCRTVANTITIVLQAPAASTVSPDFLSR